MTKTPDRFAAAYRENNPGEAMPWVCFPPSYRFADGVWRTNGEAGEAFPENSGKGRLPNKSAVNQGLNPLVEKTKIVCCVDRHSLQLLVIKSSAQSFVKTRLRTSPEKLPRYFPAMPIKGNSHLAFSLVMGVF